MTRVIIAIGLLLIGLVVAAQTCTTDRIQINYNGTMVGPWVYGHVGETAASLLSRACMSYATANGSAILDASMLGTGQPYHFSSATGLTGSGTCSVGIQYTIEGYQQTFYMQPEMGRVYETGVECPPPGECSGLPSDGVGDQFTSTVYPGANGYCNPISHCKMDVSSSIGAGGGTLYKITHTNQACATGAPPPDPDDLEDGEKCVTTSAGNEVCLAKDGKNCGYVNGNFVCLPQIDDDGCEVFGDTSRVCGPKAPTPPVPDSGTPGEPAQPDEEVTDESGDTYNYYNSGTVAGSARPPGSSGDNPYDGDDDGDGSGPVGGDDGDGEGEGECPEGATCDGTLPGGGEFEEVCTFGECAEAFFARVQGAPLVEGVLGVGAGFPPGSCPNWTLEAFGADYLLSAPMCSIWEDVSPVLSAVFLVIWGWVATRVVLSA